MAKLHPLLPLHRHNRLHCFVDGLTVLLQCMLPKPASRLLGARSRMLPAAHGFPEYSPSHGVNFG